MRNHKKQQHQPQPTSQSVNFGEMYQDIQSRANQKEKERNYVQEQLAEAATNFFESADALNCMESINFILLNTNEEGERLLESDMAPLRPLMHFLARTARLQLQKVQ